MLSEAGYASTARAPAAAASWFRAALRLLPEEEDSGREARPAARHRRLARLRRRPRGEPRRLPGSARAPARNALRSSAVAAAALVEHLLGNHDQAQGLLLAALPGLDDEAPEAAELKLEIADGCFFSADWDGMRYWAQRALEVGEPTPMLQAGRGRRAGAGALRTAGGGGRRGMRRAARRRSPTACPTPSGPRACSRSCCSGGRSTAWGASTTPSTT